MTLQLQGIEQVASPVKKLTLMLSPDLKHLEIIVKTVQRMWNYYAYYWFEHANIHVWRWYSYRGPLSLDDF